DLPAAARELAEAARLLQQWGMANPGPNAALPDAIEALAAARQVDAAHHLLQELQTQAAALDNPWVHALTERSRGLVLLAAGDPAAGLEPLAAATAAFDRLGHRPDAARAAYAHGRALLRAGQRTAGSDLLADARTRFAGMGAALWETRVAADLERAAP